MADPVTILAIAGGITGIVGGGGGAVSVVRLWLQGRREKRQDIWDSYERQIESATARGDTDEANRLRREYEAQQEAWRAQQSLEKITPKKLPTSERVVTSTSRSREKVQQMQDLLDESSDLLPAFLTPEEQILRGNALFLAGHYEDALSSFDLAMVDHPEEESLHLARGITLMELGRTLEAINALDAAIEINPRNANSHIVKGIALRRNDQHELAIQSIDRALEFEGRTGSTSQFGIYRPP